MKNSWNPIREIPLLESSALHLFKIDLQKLKNSNAKKLFHYLTDLERNRIEQYRFERDQLCFGIARAAVKLIFEKQLKLDKTQFSIEIQEYGKPCIQNNRGLHFNISHSGNIILIGIAFHYEMGVDVEVKNNEIDHIDLSKSVFSLDEHAELKILEKNRVVEGFYNCWSMKESFIKALGLGLQIPLDQFSVDFFHSTNESQLKHVAWDVTLVQKWKTLNLDIKDGYAAAYTCAREIQNICKYDLSQFIQNEIFDSDNR